MKKLYNDNFSRVTISPLNGIVDTKLRDVYMPPKICAIGKDIRVTKYKDVIFTNGKRNRLLIKGEAWSGKTTFLAKLALDWCDHTSCAMESSSINESNTSSVNSETVYISCATSVTSERMDMLVNHR
ncbi:hypothetical protein DPMN_155944 [Dreissena polymorpha]|uniref:Uncharacterized protein n=1 Tax=Dreissena polymorpha TaxID=45954 RepID=A0A9D4FSN5_DREPO|nr:hypothetical protein DPMN_155944 [Dreissena polymorpha]